MNVLFLPDYKEEHWTSMDVYANNLKKTLLSLKSPLSITSHVTLPQISKLFSSHHKQIRQIFRYIVNPLGLLGKHADVYHITDHANAHLLAALDPKKTIITCHDLTAPYWMMTYVKPTFKKQIKHWVERWRVRFLKNAAKIIAVSEATKLDIIRYLNIPEKQITVIPEGVASTFGPCTNTRILHRVKKTHTLPDTYLLHVGTTYYNKNIEGLLNIFFNLAQHNTDLYLIKVGELWTKEQAAIIHASPFAARIRHIGSVPTTDLPAIYASATALLQPSYAEGFGFTVLEAMACGCPVIISHIPALTELVQNNGIHISLPPTPAEMKTVQHLINNQKIQKKYRSLGIKWAARYTWTACAKKTLDVYTDIAHSTKTI